MNKFLYLLVLFSMSAAAQVVGINGVPNQTITGLQTGGSGGAAPQTISGCGVAYVSGLTYTVGACQYLINGVTYNSPLTNVTLSTADPTNPRIDVIYLDSTQSPLIITGTPAGTPQEPTLNSATQLGLTFVLVPAGSSTPANTTVVQIYHNGTGWVAAPELNVNPLSTNNPYTGTYDVEFGYGGPAVSGSTGATSSVLSFTVPSSGVINPNSYNNLVLYIQNKAVWPSGCSAYLQWFGGSTVTSGGVILRNGAFGFSTTNTTSYQQISIPIAAFGATNASTTTALVFGIPAQITCSFAGFYAAEISLQGGVGLVPPPTNLMNFRGTWNSTATYNVNDTVVSGGVGYVALVQNTNTAVSTSGTWTPLGLGGGGTVTSVSVVTANGVSGTVATATTTPAITLTLGAITPTSTNGVSAATMAFMDATSSVQTQLNAKASSTATMTLGSTLLTLGGTVTTVAGLTLTTPALGTPASGIATNLTGLPATGVLAGALANGMTATTQSPGDNTTKLATDAFVLANAGSSSGVTPPVYIFDLNGSTYEARNGTTGAVDYSGADAALVIRNAISNVSGTCGRLYFKPAIYNLNTLFNETATGFTNYFAAIPVPVSAATNQYCQWIIEGDSTTPLIDQFGTPVQTAGVIFNVTSTAVSSVTSTNQIIGIFARPHVSSIPAASVIERNIDIRFPDNQRGNETGSDLTQALNADYEYVTADFNIAQASLAFPVAGASGLYGLTTTASGHEQNMVTRSYAIGYDVGLDLQSEHTVCTNSYGVNTNHAVEYGFRGGTVAAPSTFINCGATSSAHGLDIGPNLAAHSRLDIIDFAFEDAASGIWAPVYHGKEANSGNTSGNVTFSNSVEGTGAISTPYTVFFDGGGGSLFNVQGTNDSNLIQASDFRIPGLSASTSPICPNGTGGSFTVAGCVTGSVSSVSNSDSTLTVTPTTGAVVASLNLAHVNTWTGAQTFPTGSAGVTQTGGDSTTKLATDAFVQTAVLSASTGAGVVTYSGPSLTLSGTLFFPIGGGATASGTGTDVDLDSPAAATIQNFSVQMSAAPGVGNTVVYTWRKNAASTALTCTITGAVATSCNDTTHTITVVQGDLMDIQAVTTGAIVGTRTVVMGTQFGIAASSGVSSLAATSPVQVSGATGAVTVSCPNCSGGLTTICHNTGLTDILSNANGTFATTCTVPANTLHAGSILHLQVGGTEIAGSACSTNYQYAIVENATTVATAVGHTSSLGSGFGLVINANFIVTKVGASGTVYTASLGSGGTGAAGGVGGSSVYQEDNTSTGPFTAYSAVSKAQDSTTNQTFSIVLSGYTSGTCSSTITDFLLTQLQTF